jgi:hypothetical protein
MNPIFEDPALPAEEIAEMRKIFYDKFYSPRYIMRQVVKGYFKGNLYSKIMARRSELCALADKSPNVNYY